MSFKRMIMLALAAVVAVPQLAQAHFPWLVVDEGHGKLGVYFGELAEPDDPAMLKYLEGSQAWAVASKRAPQEISLARTEEEFSGDIPGEVDGRQLFVLHKDFGIFSRGDTPFRLQYYAKTGPALVSSAWSEVDCGKLMPLDLIPERDGGEVRIQVLWHGKPDAGAEVNVSGPGIEDVEATSDKKGWVRFELGDAGLYSIRAKHVEDESGTIDGKSFSDVRHYSTLALRVGKTEPAKQVSKKSNISEESSVFADLPELVTSFGAAIADSNLYVFGGHTGDAHQYWNESQADTLWRLNLSGSGKWEAVIKGPRLQGLALVAHEGQLYRLGGFTAKNAEGEEHDLWSQDTVSRFDPKQDEWSPMPALPEARSSFDAAVLDGTIFVVGGWNLHGGSESHWHETAHALNLSEDHPQWKPLPQPPFQRRALSVAAHNGRVYAIGGMQMEDGPTTRVDIFDPATGEWSLGPSLNGEPMEGFGSAAFAVGGQLFVSTIRGNLQRLSEDGSQWENIHKLERSRFFHRMLPLSADKLLFVGGADMSVGKFAELDVVDVD